MKKIAFIVLILLIGGGVFVYLRTTRSESTGATTTETAADFCAIHQIAEADCPWCDPSLIEKLGFCGGHNVPEAFCSRCNPALIPGFKAENDWCGGHDVPESQCDLCNHSPLNPVASPAQSTESTDIKSITTEDLPRSRQAPSVTCQTESLRVQFPSTDVARTAGLEYATVRSQEVSQTLSCNVEMVYAEDRYGHLSSQAPGVIRSVNKTLGDRVVAGDVLAIIDSPDLSRAKAEYRREQREVEAAKKLLEANQAWYTRVNALEIGLSASRYLEARTLLDVASQNYERELRLKKQGITSERRLLEVQTEKVKARSAVDGLRRTLLMYGIDNAAINAMTETTIANLGGRGTTSEQTVLEAHRSLAIARTRLQSARDSLLLLSVTATDIDNAGESLSGTLPLKAPFDGVIVELNAVPGEIATAGTPLFALADTDQLWAVIDVAEADVPLIKAGQSVVIDVNGAGSDRFGGRITWISSAVDRRTRTLKVRANIENSRGTLRAGLFGQAEITIRHHEQALRVPRDAVQWEGCCNIVFVRHSDMLFTPRKVHLSYETPRSYVVESGVKEGEQVVTTGSFLLKTEILKGNIGAGCCEVELGKN